MSEFTYGNIIRTADKAKLIEHLPSGTPLLPLGENWLAFFTTEDGELGASEELEALSAHCPVLYFFHLEDHGWGFEIHHQGEIVSNLQVIYELIGEDLGELLDMNDQPLELEDYENQNPDAEAFKLFGLDDAKIAAIQELLAGDLTFDEDDFVAVEQFKALLGIEAMSWIRYDRTEDREEIEYV
ncbi:hypothetical protein FHS18_003882 [Paenibacillus phyllosphaerae]|uniref:Uncharacterized protein n=1 Tax=Paenibacillus phyllosphaerae TaxID=274593 RepID=A0A7W5AZU2_9BACL|nr:hypothetical protein [Paenibacillus phyllosphaerae]MBB3111814.1 hypothetical protein [Paenibacillus phyllosphaerae]